jgi:CIC family chloride channel protein
LTQQENSTETRQIPDGQSIRAGRWNFSLSSWKSFVTEREEQVFLTLALLIGALVGLIVVAFIEITGHFGAQLYPPYAAAWRRFLVPVVGSLVMGYLLYKYFPDARGSGVPQTKAALYARGGFISFSTVLGKFLCTSVTLASGIPLGREGPAVQVGGGIASVLGRAFGLRPEKVKALLPVGAAAAVAAAFNTPLAAVLFALEEVVGDLHAPVLGSVVLASATSWGVLRLLLGNEPLFQVPQYQLVTSWELIAYGILGIAGGVVSATFSQLLLRLRVWFKRQPPKTVWFQPVAGGLVVGVMGWFVPSVMGVGYQYVGDVLNDSLTLKLMLTLLVLKLVATAVSYASGNAGGIFGPSLFLGAMLGGAVGSVAQHFFPSYVASPGAYALVGMGTAFAGIIRAPMTSVVMIFEITRDYAVIVPLMLSNLVSYFIASRLQKEPIYEVLAEQDGIHLPKVGSRQRIRRQVMQILQPTGQVLSAGETVQRALELAREAQLRTWIVSDARGVVGLLTREQLESAADKGNLDAPVSTLLKAGEFPHVHADHSLDDALDRMGAFRVDALPVVSRANVQQLLGVVRLKDVLEAYGVAVEPQN